MVRSKSYRIIKTLILFHVLWLCCVNVYSAKPPERGIINIPKVTITDDNVKGIIDSVMNITIKEYNISPDYNFYFYFVISEDKSNYSLIIWADNTKNIPWSNIWDAYCIVHDYTCFLYKDFTAFFTDGNKSDFRSFDYNYTESRLSLTPVYEWIYGPVIECSYDKQGRKKWSYNRPTNITTDQLKFDLTRKTIRNRSLDKYWMREYDQIEKLNDDNGCDWPLK